MWENRGINKAKRKKNERRKEWFEVGNTDQRKQSYFVGGRKIKAKGEDKRIREREEEAASAAWWRESQDQELVRESRGNGVGQRAGNCVVTE